MKTARVVFVSKNNPEYGRVAVETKTGFLTTEISGWVKLEEGTSVGDEQPLPENSKIGTRDVVTEDGNTFTWLTIS